MIMGKNLKKFQHHQWGSIVGNEKNIRLAVLKDEIEVFESRIKPHDTGHLHTTIGTLERRIKEITEE